mgnify:CR=1 FL=1
MERGFKYRIYPNESQRDQIARTFGCCRFVYNRALDVKKTAYSETGKSIATNDLIKMIPAWKRDPETSWLAQVDSMALQQSIRDLDRAYRNFFRRVREGGKPGFPKFKSRRHARQSYRTNGGKVLDRNHIALPKLGNVSVLRDGYIDNCADGPDVDYYDRDELASLIGDRYDAKYPATLSKAADRSLSHRQEVSRNAAELLNDGKQVKETPTQEY